MEYEKYLIFGDYYKTKFTICKKLKTRKGRKLFLFFIFIYN